MDFEKTILENVTQKPFRNVTDLSMSGFISEGNQLAHFVRRFPNLRYFSMDQSRIDVTGDVTFPQIERLHLQSSYLDYEMGQLAGILSSNRHLKHLELMDIPIEMTKFFEMIDGYHSIIGLVVAGKDINQGNEVELTGFVNGHPTIRNLNLKSYIFKADDTIQFIRQSPNSTKRFEFQIKGRSDRDRILAQLGNSGWQHIADYDYDDDYDDASDPSYNDDSFINIELERLNVD